MLVFSNDGLSKRFCCLDCKGRQQRRQSTNLIVWDFPPSWGYFRSALFTCCFSHRPQLVLEFAYVCACRAYKNACSHVGFCLLVTMHSTYSMSPGFSITSPGFSTRGRYYTLSCISVFLWTYIYRLIKCESSHIPLIHVHFTFNFIPLKFTLITMLTSNCFIRKWLCSRSWIFERMVKTNLNISVYQLTH